MARDELLGSIVKHITASTVEGMRERTKSTLNCRNKGFPSRVEALWCVCGVAIAKGLG